MQALGGLLIWHDVAPGRSAATHDWYNKEHHAERLRLPGFVRAGRFQAVDPASPEFFVWYETEDPAAFSSAAYLARLNDPSPWTRWIMPGYRNMSRTVCRVASALGAAMGGAAAVLAFDGPAAQPSLQAEAALDSCFAMQGVTRCTFLTADRQIPSPTGETRLRGGSDQGISWAIIIESNKVEQAEQCLERLIALPTAASGGSALVQSGVYRRVFALHSTDLN